MLAEVSTRTVASDIDVFRLVALAEEILVRQEDILEVGGESITLWGTVAVCTTARKSRDRRALGSDRSGRGGR